ncbi:glycosyltransferase family 4 protein [Spirosoma linguale]|uniref:Glycosyl transferase group 1 n=1 Tax=Spirosoma linguale (strain ATCC 33905 / DSM 74 / LMG 10896 / Claus 1) TaxID=504472 RepID=D2QU78_SPILD|nr:glycosyl transferase group 1 [Spirosoma linguale DSM 74]
MNRKMNVLWLANYPLLENHKGHAASWIRALADAIRQDVELTIVTWKPSIEKDMKAQRDGISYVYLKSPRGIVDLLSASQLKIRKLNEFLKQHSQEFDIIHIHGSENQYLAACASIDIPKVLSIQGIISEYYKIIPELISYRRFYWLLSGYYEKKYCKKLAHFMCRTHWDTGWVNKLNPEAHVHQVWEMIRPEFFSVYDDFTENNNLLYVGGMQSIKGFKEMLQALDLVKASQNVGKLIILGGKPDNMTSVEQLIKKLQLKHVSLNDLDFRGMQDVNGMINAYRDSFCLVHPSYIDNSPNSVCEAQIAGLPVIASAVGGVSSLILDGQTGLLTGLDPNEISQQIIRLWKDKDLQKKLMLTSRQVARERHDPVEIKENVLQTYQEVIGNGMEVFADTKRISIN